MQSGNISMASETSSKFNEESRMKIDILINYFEELGWDNLKDLSQNEILLFLNKHSKQGQFDQTLAQKLFQILDVDNQNQITVEEFIKGYLQFEADLKKNNDEFNKRYMQEQNNYNNLEEQCRLYKSEKLSPEGFCENAKITVEITDVDVQKETEGINSIIIKVIYNEKTVEKKLSINKKNNNNNLSVNEKFEFKPTSRQDRFEFIMIKVDEDNVESIAAIINCKIVLFWSDYEFFEEKKKKSEMKLKKIKEASNKANYYLQKIKEIYGDLKSYELGFNNNYNQNVLLNLKQNNSKIGSNDIMKDKNYSNLNNYSNNTNDIQNNITNFRKNINEGGYEDSPEAQLNMANDSDMSDPLPFRAKKAVRLLGSLIILLSLIGSLKRPDFPNLVEGLFVVLCCYVGIRKGINKGLIWFKYALIGNSVLLFYDFIWLCTHYNFMFIGDYTGGRENLIGFLSVLCCAISFLFKSALWVFLHKQYSDIKMLKENDMTSKKINDKF